MRIRSGVGLMEVLVAVALFGIGALTLVGVCLNAAHAVDLAQQAEREQSAASRFLEHAVLWSADEYDVRLGIRRQGQWLLHIHRHSENTYVLTVADSAGHVMLETAVVRPR